MLSSGGIKGKTAWVVVKRAVNGLDGEPLKVGQKVQLSLAQAHEAVYNGTAEFCDPPAAKKAEGADDGKGSGAAGVK